MFYHDETMDDDDDDGVIGNPMIHSATLDVTALRLGIKGYVANVGHEDNQVVRGDETVEGAELELRAYDKDHATTGKYLTKGSLLATAMTGSDGFYEFNDISEGIYVVIAKSTDDYKVLRDLEVNGDRAKAVASVYEAVDETNNDLRLPSWNYRSSSANNPTNTVTLRKGTATSETFTFQNFALLHMDGEFLGRVYEARDDAGDIAVELRRCETVTGDVRCREETEFDAQTENTSSRGTWTFDGLREGFYAVNVAATNYRQAKWDSDGIDDDAVACDGSDEADANCDSRRNLEVVDSLVGKRAFNRERANFYVYNSSLGDDAELDGIVIEGTTHAQDDAEELADITITAHADGTTNSLPAVASAITWASEEITVTPDLSDPEASVRVVVGDLESPDDVGSGGHGDDITVDLEGGTNTVTVIVTAENGYHDRVYSFAIIRTTPVDAQLAGLGLRTERDAEAGSEVSINPEFAPARTEYTATVPPGTRAGTTMSVYVLATVQSMQHSITATYSDGTMTEELPEETRRVGDGSLEKVYEVEIPKTGALTDKSVLVKVTGENGTTMLTYEIELQRGGDVVAPGTTSLSALSLTGVSTLVPAFTSGTTSYTASVASTVDKTTVTATAANGAMVDITPADADASTDGHQVNLAVGAKTTITIKVSLAGMEDNTYTVDVTRGPSTPTPAEPGLTLNPDEKLAIGEGGVETYTMVLKTAPTADVTVMLAMTATVGTADAVSLSRESATFTTTNWSTPQTVSVLVADDENQDDEMVTIAHAITSEDEAYTNLDPVELVVTVTDDDKTAGLTVSSEQLNVEEGNPTGVPYTVALTAAPTENVTVAVSVMETGDAAQAVTVAPASLTFTTANWETAQIVTVKAGEDDDGTDGNVTLRHAVTVYGRTVFATQEVTVTVTDNDDAGLMISATAMEIAEGGSASYDVQLATKPTANVTVTIAGFAVGDVSVNPSGFTFTVANWNRVQTVMVSAGADEDPDIDDVVNLTHTAGDYADDIPGVSVTVMEAAIAAVVVSHTELTIVEGTIGREYRLTLTQAPAAGETVTVTVGSPADISTSVSSASLGASNWSTGVTVRVTSPDDGVTEGSQIRAVTHTVASSNAAGKYKDYKAASAVTVTVTDPAK